MCKECKGCKEYKSFDELPQDFKELYKGKETKQGKDAYVDFINKLNVRGDELISDYINTSTKVRIHYGKCSHEHPEGEGVAPDNYKSGCGCGICHGFIVVEGDNDLATTHPQFIEYFPNIEDTYTHTYASHDEIEMKCPICRTKKVMSIKTLVFQGFRCPKCGDGVKYPEKVLALLLDSLNIKFKKQLKFDGHKFLYDFYLVDYDIIIEVHGGQHYESGWRSYEEEHENDLIKYDIAVLNGYEYNKNYFIIDARESNIKWLRNSIEQCVFFQQFDLNNIDWEEIDKQAQKSKKVEVCLYWKEQKETNKDLTTTIMAEIFNIDKTTIVRWLTWGNESGLCTYSGEKESKANTRRQSKFVYLIKPDGTKWYDEAMSQRELARLTGIAKYTINRRSEYNNPLDGKNAKYDSKYIGSYIVEADEWDAQHN